MGTKNFNESRDHNYAPFSGSVSFLWLHFTISISISFIDERVKQPLTSS